MADRVQYRRDTLERWNSVNPVLMDGEVALVATDPAKPNVYNSKKVGDGVHRFSELEMLGYECLQELGDSTQFPMSQKAVTDYINVAYYNPFIDFNSTDILESAKGLVNLTLAKNVEIPENVELYLYGLLNGNENQSPNFYLLAVENGVIDTSEEYRLTKIFDYGTKGKLTGVHTYLTKQYNEENSKYDIPFYVTLNWDLISDKVVTSTTTHLNKGVIKVDNVINQNLVNEKLVNKKIVTFGDSITWYNGQKYNWGKEEGIVAKGYQYYLGLIGMLVNNQGVSGYTMPEISNIITHFTIFSEMNYMTLMSGANDTRKNIPVGEVMEIGSNYNISTYIGAMQKGIDFALTQNPRLKICLFTPIPGWIYAPKGFEPPQDADKMVSSEYANAVKEVGKKYSIPVLDLYNMVGFNIFNREIMMNDPEPPENTFYLLHPSTLGFQRMSDLIIPFLNSI